MNRILKIEGDPEDPKLCRIITDNFTMHCPFALVTEGLENSLSLYFDIGLEGLEISNHRMFSLIDKKTRQIILLAIIEDTQTVITLLAQVVQLSDNSAETEVDSEFDLKELAEIPQLIGINSVPNRPEVCVLITDKLECSLAMDTAGLAGVLCAQYNSYSSLSDSVKFSDMVIRLIFQNRETPFVFKVKTLEQMEEFYRICINFLHQKAGADDYGWCYALPSSKVACPIAVCVN